MKVELHINGSHQVLLYPETPVELAILREMTDSAAKGRAVRISVAEDSKGNVQGAVVSVEA